MKRVEFGSEAMIILPILRIKYLLRKGETYMYLDAAVSE